MGARDDQGVTEVMRPPAGSDEGKRPLGHHVLGYRRKHRSFLQQRTERTQVLFGLVTTNHRCAHVLTVNETSTRSCA